MRAYVAIASASLLLLQGCATGAWFHPTATEAKFRQDAMECEYDARKATAGIRSGMEAGYEQASLTRMCLQVRGYEWRADQR